MIGLVSAMPSGGRDNINKSRRQRGRMYTASR